MKKKAITGLVLVLFLIGMLSIYASVAVQPLPETSIKRDCWPILWEDMYSTGQGWGIATQDNETVIVSQDGNITKRNALTGEYLWSTTFGKTRAYDVCFDSNHNFAVVGYEYIPYQGHWYMEYYNGTTNSLIWSGFLEFQGITTGAAACIFDSEDMLIIVGKGGNHYPTVAKYYPHNGTKVWSTNDESGYDWAITYTDVAVDSNDNVIAAGRIQGADYTARICKLDDNGNVLWSKNPVSSSSDGCSVGVDSDDNILFGGYNNIDSTSRLIKYAPNGTVLWQNNDFGSDVSFRIGHKSIASYCKNKWIVGGRTEDEKQDLIYYFIDENGSVIDYVRRDVGDDEYMWGVEYEPISKLASLVAAVNISNWKTWSSVLTHYPVFILSNSTVSNFNFNQTKMQISFDVTGESGITGCCNVTIPKSLLKGSPWTIKVDDTTITDFDEKMNATHTFLYFTYTHESPLHVAIEGTWVVPEYPGWASTLLVLIVFTVTIAIHKRRLLKHSRK